MILKKVFPLLVLLWVLPLSCFADPTGLRDLPIVAAIFGFAAFTALLNIVSLAITFSGSRFSMTMLWICLSLNCLWLAPFIWALYNRCVTYYSLKNMDDRYKADFIGLTWEGIVIMLIISGAIVTDILLIRQKRRKK